MRVRNGEINIVDLSNDYYFVTFSNKEYQDRAILEEMWSLNFNMKINVIQQVAVSVRFSRLSIKHCDYKVLSFISNMIDCW